MHKALMGLSALALVAAPALAAPKTVHISGQGTLYDGRTFSLNAMVDANGNVSGQATLVNHAFTGENGKSPYISHITLSCLKQVDGEYILGGDVTHTNDPNLDDAAFFAVSDDGNQLSGVYFWDDQPGHTGDASACQFNEAGDYPTADIIRGNIHVN
jgi:hypothetical protein